MSRVIVNYKGKGRLRADAPTDSEAEPLDHAEQVRLVSALYMDPSALPTEQHKRLLAEVKRKRNGYKTQDVRRELFATERFITLESILEHLVAARFRCAYCHEPVEAFYTRVRAPRQWTLDRIDNSQGHTRENTVVSCLRCNLHRRTTDYEKFKFTKELDVVKLI